MSPAPDQECAAMHDDLASLALGTLTGVERARVIDHVERCHRCSRELEELSATTDALIMLVPDAAPPQGFATRTMERLRAGSPRSEAVDATIRPGQLVTGETDVGTSVDHDDRRGGAGRRAGMRWSRTRILTAAAVVVALALGVGFGAMVFSNGGAPAPSHVASHVHGAVRTAALQSDVGVHGTVAVSDGKDGWLVVTVKDVPGSVDVTCVVHLTDGTQQTVGRFLISDGYGSWGIRLSVPGSSVRSVHVLNQMGTNVASAVFSA